jgi:3-hydroxyisobutyrate dehydrogenase-like beta-hydroxyacid dehydrogenase
VSHRTRVAFIGLGRMGAPMAARLAAAGHDLTVYNRTPRADCVPEGAVVATSPAQSAASVEVIVTMLADAAALDAVLDGPGGLLAGCRRGTVLVDMSTIGPIAARDVGRRCAEHGIGFVDAPVSGSVTTAQTGELLAMVGGEDADVKLASPVLKALTGRQIHLGPVGSGATMKLAVNLMLAVTNQAIAETLTLAERGGIPRPLAYEVLVSGVLASPFMGYKRAAFEAPESAAVAFSIGLMHKDVELALQMAAAGEVEPPVGLAAADVLRAAVAAGSGDADIAAIIEMLNP